MINDSMDIPNEANVANEANEANGEMYTPITVNCYIDSGTMSAFTPIPSRSTIKETLAAADVMSSLHVPSPPTLMYDLRPYSLDLSRLPRPVFRQLPNTPIKKRRPRRAPKGGPIPYGDVPLKKRPSARSQSHDAKRPKTS